MMSFVATIFFLSVHLSETAVTGFWPASIVPLFADTQERLRMCFGRICPLRLA